MSLLPEVRDELVATARRRAAAGAPRRRRGGAVAVALGVACTVAVVVVGVVALGHRAPASQGSTGSGLAGLEAKLSILRRPQTPADRTYARYSGVGGAVIAKLARLATTVDTAEGRARVYLVVRQLPLRPAEAAAKLRSQFATAVAVDEHGQVEGETGPVTATTLEPNAVGASGVVIRGIGIERNRGLSVGIVPDGVRRVRWTFTGEDYGILDPHPVTVYPEVHGNVAVAPIRRDQGPLASAVWYGAGGGAGDRIGGSQHVQHSPAEED